MAASGNGTFSAITAAQARAARALLGWSQDALAATSGVPKRTLARFEAIDSHAPQPRTIAAIRTALEAAGVEFIPENGGGPGVRLRKADGR